MHWGVGNDIHGRDVQVVVNDIHDFDMLGLVHKMVRGGMLTSGHFYDQCWYRKCV